MDLPQELIGKILGKVRELDADGRVRFIALYGSLVEGRGSGLSDIDVALYYDGGEEERFSFRVALQGELGERFDVQIFQDLPLYVRREIVARGRVIFYTDYDFLFNVYLQTLREYSDFERHLRTYYSYLEGAEVDKGRILAKLEEMSRYVEELREMLPPQEEYHRDLVRRRACEKTVELAIEALLDAAAVLVSSQRFGLPESEESIVDLLVEKGVITQELGRKVKGMKGFRNILVHRYGRKEDRLVYAFLTQNLGDFAEFEAQVKRYLQKV